LATECRDVCGTGVIPNGESCRIGKIDQAGELGAANKVDRRRARRADFGREHFLACTADNDRNNPGRFE
jgi:hypothetical protein